MLPQSISDLSQTIRTIPGLGAKSSQKMAIDLLQMSQENFQNLINTMTQARQKVGFCKRCGFFAEGNLCQICSNTSRNLHQICIVEKPTDVLSLEKSEIYYGVYHVLNKLISPLDNIFAENTTIANLVETLIQTTQDSKEIELILFLRPSFATEATTAYIKETLKNQNLDKLVKITRMAQGLPLYYNPDTLDSGTMIRALEDRKIA